MLNGDELKSALISCQSYAVPYRGNCYRWTHIQWCYPFSKFQPLYSAAGGVGTRYAPKDGPAVFYVAFDAVTAEREFNQNYYQTLNSPFGSILASAGAIRPDPGVIMGVHIHVNRLLDLNSQETMRLLDANRTELLVPWKNASDTTATQSLGKAVYAGNWFEGIVYPSAQHANHNCLVLYRERLLSKPALHFRGFTTSENIMFPDQELP